MCLCVWECVCEQESCCTPDTRGISRPPTQKREKAERVCERDKKG
jgi:hypothetical protein